MKYLIFLFLAVSFSNLSAQNDSSDFQTRRDWFVGKYMGYENVSLNADTASGTWWPDSINITYGDNPDYINCYNGENGIYPYKICEDSMMMVYFFDDTVCNVVDSLFYNEFGNAPYFDGFAKLFPDSTIEWWYYAPPASGNYWVYFKGKKIISYAGIKTTKNPEIKIMPNPVARIVTIASDKNLDKVVFYNISGVQVISINPGNHAVSIDVGVLPNGLYLVKIQTKNSIVTRKIVKW